jgi:uncharacterized OB-fold protein
VATRPIAANVFATSPLRLIGGRHRENGQIVFPLPADPANFEPVDLPTQGSLWSYTVQRFPPKSPPYRGPAPFAPYAVGYVELPHAVIVESLLTGVEFTALRVGLPMELTTIPVRTDEDGTTVVSYAFRPSAGSAA